MEVKGSNIFKISSFVFNKIKKFIQVWNNLRVSKIMTEFSFLAQLSFYILHIQKEATLTVRFEHHERKDS